MLTVRDILDLPALGISLAGGAEGVANEVSWLHVSELADPTPFLEGGELLLTTGLAVGELASAQRRYVRRLAEHRLAALGFGVGFGFATVPPAIVREADRLGFPVLSVPYEVPFVAITKAAVARLASDELERQTRALQVHERLSEAVLAGRGVDALLAVLCSHLQCSVGLVDETGRVLAERHPGRRVPFESPLELPVTAGTERATLRASRGREPLGEYDRLVLHHGQTALAFELARRHAVSAAELRLAGDLLEDLEQDRLDEREAARRMAAFGLDARTPYAALLAVLGDGGGEPLRRAIADALTQRGVRFLSTARPDRAAFLVEAETEDDALAIADSVAARQQDARVAVGRPAVGRDLGRSLLEARAALEAGAAPVASYRDLGSLELLLGLPDASLEAFVDRVLGPAAENVWLLESLEALLDSGYRWADAADTLRVHRHTLRYRMDKLRDLTGRHPDEPAQRMELWLAVKAAQALDARRARALV